MEDVITKEEYNKVMPTLCDWQERLFEQDMNKQEWEKIEKDFKEWDEKGKFSASQRQILDWFKKRFSEQLNKVDVNKSSLVKYKFKVITLCGSTRFKKSFIEQQKRLTLDGNIVVSVGLFGHSGDKEMLKDIHLCKIDMADEIFVINEDFYIGDSTKREIAYAIKTGKPVNYMLNVPH